MQRTISQLSEKPWAAAFQLNGKFSESQGSLKIKEAGKQTKRRWKADLFPPHLH